MNKEGLQRKSSPRLREFDYVGSYSFFITCSTYRKRAYFNEKAMVDTIVSVLRNIAEQNNFNVYTYCFMPDHLHLLLLGTDNSNLSQFLKIFKQRSSFMFRKASGDILWQRSFYDHVLRKDEALKRVALYILNNPVRSGLVTDYKSYPFSGSFVFNIAELE
jgi:putative transposase